MNAIWSVGFIQKIIQSYKRAMKPLAVKYKISPSMIAILMFLGNNPQCKHAKDIVEFRGIKANLVSMSLEKMEKEGYVTLQVNPKDRREKTIELTDQAMIVFSEGKQLQTEFFKKIFKGVSREEINVFMKVVRQIDENTKNEQ